MVLTKILKRRDGASVVVAIVLALIVSTMLTSMVNDLSQRLINNNRYNAGTDWFKDNYITPVVAALLAILILEILCWLYVWTVGSMKKR
jgi:H+/gluconate symporter-like permease